MLTSEIITSQKEFFIQELSSASSFEDIDVLKNSQIGKTGIIAWWFKEMSVMDIEGKKSIGPIISDYKLFVELELEKAGVVLKKEKIDRELQNELVDFSISVAHDSGYDNLIQKELRRMLSIFAKYGFTVNDGHELVTKYQNFYSVNIPATHPATEIHDTLYLKQKDVNSENFVLRTHTSCMQVEYLQKYGPECKFVVPGRVYRAESMDATHDVAFRQVEWVCIMKDMNIPKFKYDLKLLLSEIFEDDIDIRLRPWYFPFTEPSYEVDILCTKEKNPELFALSKNRGTIEILGCGMIHPNVLREAGVDPEVYAGYAFGFGLTRMIAIKYGIKDIRLLTNGDLRFVKSF